MEQHCPCREFARAPPPPPPPPNFFLLVPLLCVADLDVVAEEAAVIVGRESPVGRAPQRPGDGTHVHQRVRALHLYADAIRSLSCLLR
jgi:hypothetical protein